jgi:large subunit ribosomal protein L24
VQTTLLGLAIAFIIALVAALIGPHYIDLNQFRPQFEAEATKVIGAPVRVAGSLDARILPTPSLRLRSVVVGGANDLGKVRAERLDVEFSLGDLMRGEWRANELTVAGMALDLGLDRDGRIDWPASNGTFDPASLAIDRLNLTGRVALHDAVSRKTIELSDIAFSGDVRSLAGTLRGGGHFTLEGTRYPYRVTSSQGAAGGARVHLAVDPGEHALSVDLDGTLRFEARAPRFEGGAILAVPPSKTKASDQTPWRIVAKVKADHLAAQLEQIEASYGADDRALKLAGVGDIRLGGSPELHATLSARQLDADRLLSKDKDAGALEPMRMLPALRAALASLPNPPIPAKIEAGAEQIILGGRPLQNLSATVHGDAATWALDRLDVRAPGATQVSFASSSTNAPASLAGKLDIESNDPDVLMAWLQGRGDIGLRSQKPLRVHGDISVAGDRLAVEGLKAEIDGGAVEGRLALLTPPGSGSRLEAALKAERLDLDAASAFVRSIGGAQVEWPHEASIALDIDRAISGGQELHPFNAKFGFSPKTLSLEQLKFGQANGVAMEGSGSFDRAEATGELSLSASSASIGQITAMVAPLAPGMAARLNAIAMSPGPARLKLALNISKNSQEPDRANAHAVLDLNTPQLRGVATLSARPSLAAIRSVDLDEVSRGEVSVETKLSAERGDALLTLLGLDRAIAAGEGTVRFEGSANGMWRAPLRLNAKMWGANIDAEAQGTAEPWASTPKANINLRVRSVNLAPLFDLKPSDSAAQNIRLFAHVSLAGNKLTFDDLDSIVAGSRLRGHLALTLDVPRDEPREVDGEVGLEALDVASAFALVLGAGHEVAEPFRPGLLKGWRGRVAFQALNGVLPGGIELRPLGGVAKNDGQSLTLEALKGKIGGGDATATIDARQEANGVALNARVELSGVDGSALHYRGLKMPAGRASLQMTLVSQGRSVQALTGALSGSGTVTLEGASIAGLEPRAFEVAVRASDSGQATNDARLRQIVEPVLAAGALPVASAQIPFSIRDGRLRVDPTTLDGTSARVTVSGGYDIAADQADIRVSLTSGLFGAANSRPEIQLFAAGPPDTLNRTVDVGSLSSWLAVRAIDRETRRLDAIERGEPPPVEPSIPPSTAALPSVTTREAAPPEAPLSGRDSRRLQPKAKAVPSRPATVSPSPPQSSTPQPSTSQPVASQQAAPLPPPIEVRPAPGPPPKPKPRRPIMLAPPAANP